MRLMYKKNISLFKHVVEIQRMSFMLAEISHTTRRRVAVYYICLWRCVRHTNKKPRLEDGVISQILR
jgi:hypothetical protein